MCLSCVAFLPGKLAKGRWLSQLADSSQPSASCCMPIGLTSGFTPPDTELHSALGQVYSDSQLLCHRLLVSSVAQPLHIPHVQPKTALSPCPPPAFTPTANQPLWAIVSARALSHIPSLRLPQLSLSPSVPSPKAGLNLSFLDTQLGAGS